MWFGRYLPGLQITAEAMSTMTPEATRAVRRAGEKLLKAELDVKIELTKALAKARF